MADEITVVTGLAFVKGSQNVEMPVNRETYDMSGTYGYLHSQSVGITAEALEIGEIAADDLSWLYVHNIDSTNFVTIHKTGETGGVYVGPGDHQVFRFNSTPYATADTAAVILKYCVVQMTAVV